MPMRMSDIGFLRINTPSAHSPRIQSTKAPRFFRELTSPSMLSRTQLCCAYTFAQTWWNSGHFCGCAAAGRLASVAEEGGGAMLVGAADAVAAGAAGGGRGLLFGGGAFIGKGTLSAGMG
eukprot:scaffold263894_cov17-Tisochrysis_lutea.AAC.1